MVSLSSGIAQFRDSSAQEFIDCGIPRVRGSRASKGGSWPAQDFLRFSGRGGCLPNYTERLERKDKITGKHAEKSSGDSALSLQISLSLQVEDPQEREDMEESILNFTCAMRFQSNLRCHV